MTVKQTGTGELTVTNNNAVAVTLSYAESGGNASPDTACQGVTVQPGSNCKITLSFNPTTTISSSVSNDTLAVTTRPGRERRKTPCSHKLFFCTLTEFQMAETTNHVLANGRKMWLSSVTGEVISSETRQHTVIRQGPHTAVGRSVVPGKIHSVLRNETDLWIRRADGGEQQLRLGGLTLACRAGHQVSAAWGGQSGSEDGAYVVAKNHTTGECIQTPSAIVGQVSSGGDFWRALMLIPAGVFAGVILGLMCGSGSGMVGPCALVGFFGGLILANMRFTRRCVALSSGFC